MISVCMATYNGEKYVQRQLFSILKQIDKNDEIIIVDDCSTDKTLEQIKKIGDSRISLHINEKNMGVNKTFEKALCMANGEIIFLSDQDDIWKDDKVKIVMRYLEKNPLTDLIQHDAVVIDDENNVLMESFFAFRGYAGSSVIRNFIKGTHLGCCMAMRKKMLHDCLPISEMPYYDKWLIITAVLCGHKVECINEKLIYYVRHNGTVTDKEIKRRSWLIIIWDRVKYFLALLSFMKKHNCSVYSLFK